MNDQREEAKIEKYAEKKKSGPIIKIMDKADTEVLIEALKALGGIADEDSANKITHYLDHPDAGVRVAACQAALVIDTDYMKTRVRHQLAVEQDTDAKKQIESPRRHQKRQGGIQAAGNPDDRAGTPGVLQPFFQAVGLDGKNLLAAPRLRFLIRRDEGLCGEKSPQGKLLPLHVHREDQISVLFRCREGVHPPSFMAQSVNIQISVYSLVFKPSRFGEQGAVFRDQVVPPTNVEMMDRLGGSATPMGFGEVYTSLQSHIIDGAENNEMALTDNGHGDVCKYYSYDMHQMIPDILIGNNDFLEGLSSEERAIFDEGFALVNQVQREEWVEAVENAKDRAQNEQGVTFLYPDTEPFKEACLPMHEQMLGNYPDLVPIYDAIQAYNQQYPAEES